MHCQCATFVVTLPKNDNVDVIKITNFVLYVDVGMYLKTQSMHHVPTLPSVTETSL